MRMVSVALRVLVVAFGGRVAKRGRVNHRAPTDPRRRSAAACLPAAIASVIVGLFPRPATPQSAPDLHSQIEQASKAPLVRLQLSSGLSVSGVFTGFIGDWRDSVASATRYEAWRATRPEGVPRLGDSLSITLVSGDTLRGAFGGVGPGRLLLGLDNPIILTPVAHDSITGVAWDTSAQGAGWTELRARMFDAPLVAGVVLKLGTRLMIVPRESIKSAKGEGGAGGGSGSSPALVIVGLAAGVAMILICVSAANEAGKQAGDNFVSSCSRPFSPSQVDNQFPSGGIMSTGARWAQREALHP